MIRFSGLAIQQYSIEHGEENMLKNMDFYHL